MTTNQELGMAIGVAAVSVVVIRWLIAIVLHKYEETLKDLDETISKVNGQLAATTEKILNEVSTIRRLVERHDEVIKRNRKDIELQEFRHGELNLRLQEVELDAARRGGNVAKPKPTETGRHRIVTKVDLEDE